MRTDLDIGAGNPETKRFLGFFLLKKTPGYAGEFKKALAVQKNKTPFDTIKMRLPTASNKSKGGHSK